MLSASSVLLWLSSPSGQGLRFRNPGVTFQESRGYVSGIQGLRFRNPGVTFQESRGNVSGIQGLRFRNPRVTFLCFFQVGGDELLDLFCFLRCLRFIFFLLPLQDWE
eukprot:753952-Amorphochlora_amoeboformis.AAC.1